ncbi:MAG: DNA repair protein RecO [Synechococcus sp.]|nr:DNA repair protein RecO [Synechococcus sp.]
MSDTSLEGLALRVQPLGENDRLLTLLSETEGLSRLAVPGSRRPRSSLAAAVPLSHLQLQVVGRRGLRRVRQLRLLRSYGSLGQRLETLAAAQVLAELCLVLVPELAPTPGMLATLLLHLGRLELVVREHGERREALAIVVQGCVHLLALGGYAVPLQSCCRSGAPLEPPLGDHRWRASLIAGEGLAIGRLVPARLLLGASELALLQRLPRPGLPLRASGELLGPERVWLELLELVALWCGDQLGRSPRAFAVLRSACGGRPPLQDSQPSPGRGLPGAMDE